MVHFQSGGNLLSGAKLLDHSSFRHAGHLNNTSWADCVASFHNCSIFHEALPGNPVLSMVLLRPRAISLRKCRHTIKVTCFSKRKVLPRTHAIQLNHNHVIIVSFGWVAPQAPITRNWTRPRRPPTLVLPEQVILKILSEKRIDEGKQVIKITSKRALGSNP